ncbi:MAG: outer membrane protein transport protein [Bacteroidota bacterium]
MKNYLSFIMVMLCAILSAQNINDVLRYGGESLQGTARYQAMGGAFGALGGDLSGLNSNPAGSAVFNNSLMTITGTYFHRENESAYFDRSIISDMNTTDMNQFGSVFVFKNTDTDSSWKKVSIALNYDLARNFDNQVFVAGNSNQGIDNYFRNFAQGVPFGALLVQDGEFLEEAYLDIGAAQGFGDQQAFLGYYGGVIDPLDDTDNNNTDYVSNADYTTVNQEYVRNTSGFNSKFTFNLGTQYDENLYFGASANFHSILYEELTTLDERGFRETSDIQFINFDNLLRTEGWGFSYSLGAILKLNENVRLGGSYQSKTWYRLTDNLSQRIDSDLADQDIGFINFNVVNVFEEYTVEIPEKFTGSAAIIFGKDGLLSFDYTYQDMSQAELLPNRDPAFSSENAFISQTLRPVSTFRAGGEFRIDRLSLRGGYRLEQSPYEDPDIASDLIGYSAGLGYSFGSTRLDLTVNRTEQEVNQQLFSTGLPTPALINRINTNVTLGLTLNF